MKYRRFEFYIVFIYNLILVIVRFEYSFQELKIFGLKKKKAFIFLFITHGIGDFLC